MWRSLVARFVRDEEVAGSNPVTPTSGAVPAAVSGRRVSVQCRKGLQQMLGPLPAFPLSGTGHSPFVIDAVRIISAIGADRLLTAWPPADKLPACVFGVTPAARNKPDAH